MLKDLSEPALVQAVEQNLFEWYRRLGASPGIEVHDEPRMLWGLTDIHVPIFNGVLRAQIQPGEVDAAIDEVLGRAKVRGVPIMWWTGPVTEPSDLPQALEARGFVREESAPGMALHLDRLIEDAVPLPTGFEIERVRDVETLYTWCSVMVPGFGLPDVAIEGWHRLYRAVGVGADAPVRHFLGRLEGRDVATASVNFGAGVGGIYNVSTQPEARGRGIGYAISLRAALEARQAGYEAALLHSSEMGHPVYLRMGFRD
ncbi:MAG: GNAT family N-acetyltransferase [Myxococcota bacterium]